jgi:enoyl-CoA hydratase/carnithine racemase
MTGTRIAPLSVEKREEVAWILLNPYQETTEAGWGQAGFAHIGAALAEALERLRFDPSVRIVVITGAKDGEFYRVVRGPAYDPGQCRSRGRAHGHA